MAKPVLVSIIAKDHTVAFKYDRLLDDTVFVNPDEFVIVGNAGAIVFILESGTIFQDTVYIGTQQLIPITDIITNWAGDSIVSKESSDSADPIINNLAINNSTGIDNTKPTFIGGWVKGYTGAFFFSEVLNPAIIPAAGNFFVFADDIVHTAMVINISGTMVTLAFAEPCASGQVTEAQYNKIGTALQDIAGNQVDSFGLDETLENRTEPFASAEFGDYNTFIKRWGIKNVRIASNKDNDDVEPDFVAIQEAFDYAVEEINDAIADGPYTVPLVLPSVPRRVREWFHVIAYEHLYNSRGVHEERARRGVVGVGNRVSAQLQRVYNQMAYVRLGLSGIPGAQYTGDFNSTPLIVTTDQVQLQQANSLWGFSRFSWDIFPSYWWFVRF